jgi:two-component system chemotaxis sensor kinase CheA
MADPLMHLLRNAVDHGIESSEDRRRAGKPSAGTIILSAEHRGGYITINISDDGRGMSPATLTAAAIRKGIINERDAERLTPEQAYALIFRPGFSTRDEVTAISGRGVGMDVVKSNIDALKGRIEIDSVAGRGTTFRVHLPLSISVIQVIVVECAGQSFCLPATGVSEIVRVADHELASEDGKACVTYRGKAVPVVRLADLLGIDDRRPIGRSAIAITTGLEGTVGLVVDRAVAEQTVLVKDMGKLLRRVPHVSGGTILPDGHVAVILDVVSLVAKAIRGGGTWVHEQAPASTAPARKTLLVVDDSLTTRELIRGLLESAGYDVVMARHGREAWEVLQSPRALDLVVSDVNMPEMDGYELATKIKADRRLSRVPVVLVTSLAKPEEQLKGMQAGADAYIVKGAFDQSGLLARVRELVGSDG